MSLEAIFRQNAGQQDYTPSSAVVAGQVERLDDGRACIVQTSLAADAKGAVATEGIWDVASESAVEFSKGDRVFWDVSANTAVTAKGAADDFCIGTAVAAKASGDLWVRVDINEGVGIDPEMLAVNSAYDAVVPFVVHATVTAEAEALTQNVIAAMPADCKVIDAWMHSRDTTAANVTLKNDGTAFTAATAKGTSDDARVAFASLVAEQDEVTAGDAVTATFSAAASADITLLCIRV